MIAQTRYHKPDTTALLKQLAPSEQVSSRETNPNEWTGPIGGQPTVNRWVDHEPSEFELPSTGDFPSGFPETPRTESSNPKVNTIHRESTFSQSIRVLHYYSVRIDKILNGTAYVHLSEDGGTTMYAQRRVDDFGGLIVQEGDLLTLRVYIENNELKHAFEPRSNSFDHEAYAAFRRDISDIYTE
jgi:hypothetical protein